ncbi:MAG: YiaA/YiaB family inner membrane protein [Saprospiraceae bacterium]
MSYYMYENVNTKSFYNMAWIGFVISLVGMVLGLVYLESTFAMKGFLAMSYLFSLTSCFTVAKVVRDRHEADKFINKVENAKTEKLLNENGKLAGVV